MLNIGWFTTGRDEAARQLLQVMLESIRTGDIKGRITFVFSNREAGENLESDRLFELVRKHNLRSVCLSYEKFKKAAGAGIPTKDRELPPWRLEYDRKVMKLLEGFPADLCVLAGYMLIAGPEMCRRYKLLNLHPAEPGGPTGTWQDVVWKLIEERAARSGVMMHLATPDLDRGPVATYCTYPIHGREFDALWKEIEGQSISTVRRSQGERNRLFQAIRREGLSREFPLIVATLKAFSRDEIAFRDSSLVDSTGKEITGLDLTDQVETIVKAGGRHEHML